MATLNFPSNPTVNQTYDFGPYRYRWDGEKWSTVGNGFNGVTQLVSQAREALRRSYSGAGYTLVTGSFETGATLTNSAEVLLYELEGKAYKWAGTFPKVVPQFSTPANSGDLGPTAWIPVSSETLRSDLSDQFGVGLVNGANYAFSNVASMVASALITPRDGDIVMTRGYYDVADGGGSVYTYSSGSTATVDGFLVHNCAAGGRWLLVDNRSRLPMQVAGAKVDGVTDDRVAFLAVLAAKRHMYLSGVMSVSGSSINLSTYVTSQRLEFSIEGNDPIGSVIEFTTGAGGFNASSFFRGLTVRNLNIRNKTLDKSGVGFTNDSGAEMLNLENVTFTGWRCGANIHAWNSSIKNIASRACYYAGSFYGTSQDDSSLYSVGCDYAWAFGCKYSGGLSGTMGLPSAGLALSYAHFRALAADESGPYLFGRCFNFKVGSLGAERGIGPYLFDLSLYSGATARQLVSIECADVYVQAADGVTAIFGPLTNGFGSLIIENSRFFSDKNIPLFSGDGRGIKKRNTRYASSSTKPVTSGVTNGLVIDEELIIGSDYAQLTKEGYNQGGFDQVRKVKAFLAMAVSATSKVVIRIQDTSVTGLAQGVFVAGTASFHPANKGGSNAARDAGIAHFSVAADFAGGLSSINLQKLGSLAGLTATNRTTGTVQELVLTLPAAAVQYFCELSFWCNGKFDPSSVIDYYVES